MHSQGGEQDQGRIKPEKMQQSLEYLIRDTDSLVQSASGGSSIEPNMDFEDYSRFFTEVKEALLVYAKEQKQSKVAETADQLKLLRLGDYLPLNGFLDLVADTGNMGNRAYIEKFREDVSGNKRLLEKLLLYVKNPAFQEVM
jgi:hypothetical protein